MKAKDIIKDLSRTTEEVFSIKELTELLDSGKKLRIKYGVDVTAPTLHIGHAVNLWMMRKLQDLGHKVIFLIGDFTTSIGDPTGKNALRPIIAKEEIEKNLEEFIKQAKMVLRFDDPELIEVRRNSEWFGEMPTSGFLNKLMLVTHAKLISRDMFRDRIDKGDDIYMHELIYPILQGWDSVELESDLTIIGTDQLFNEMLGRFFQEKSGQKPQVIMTTKITPGIDGRAKQSKSIGNYIGLAHSPREKFGRVMSIPDDLVESYFIVYTDIFDATIAKFISEGPMLAKLNLATEIVRRYHGDKIAESEKDWFIKTFSDKQSPDDMPEVTVSKSSNLTDLIKQCIGESESNAGVRRLIDQGAVSIDSTKVEGNQFQPLPITNTFELKIGKRRWFKVKIKP